MEGVPQIVAGVIEQTQGLSDEEKLKVLNEQAGGVTAQMPPRENKRINVSLESVHASGPLGHVHVVLRGNNNYQQTGLLQATTAYNLVNGASRRVGFASACQAFGHRELLGTLQSWGFVGQPEVTGTVSAVPLPPPTSVLQSSNGAGVPSLAAH
jgi:hypothetical protein